MQQHDPSDQRGATSVVEVLGNTTIGGQPLTKRQRRIVSFLALHNERAIGTERLIDAVWNGSPPRSARQSLQNQIARLRTAFGPDIIRTGPDGYRLGRPTDADIFEAVARIPLQSMPERVAETELERALTLWRGRPFDDLDDVDDVDAARARLEELHAVAEEQLMASRLATGEAAVHLGELSALVASQPFRERRWALLMTGLHTAGRTTEALQAFARLRTMLRDELGTEPTQELDRLRHAIAAGAAIPTTADVDLRGARATNGPMPRRQSTCGGRAPRQHRSCSAA